MKLRDTLIRERPFVPRLRPGVSPLVAWIGSLPRLLGMVSTWPKALPGVELPIVSDDGAPVLANWRVGLGQVAAFTSDADGRWSGDWVASPIFDKFWSQVVRGVVRPGINPAAEATIAPTTSGRLKITVHADDASGGFDNFPAVSVKVFGPDTNAPARSIALTQTGPGLYEGEYPAPTPGAYLATVSLAAPSGPVGWTAATYVVDRSAEWRDLKSNEAALDAIAAKTGGRVIRSLDHRVNLFNHEDLYPRSASIFLKDTLLVWAIVALLLDVAVRRIAWDRHTVPTMATALSAFVRSYTASPTPKGQAAVGALGALRRSKNSKLPAAPQMAGSFAVKEKPAPAHSGGSPTPVRTGTVSRPVRPEPHSSSDPADPMQRLAAANRRSKRG